MSASLRYHPDYRREDEGPSSSPPPKEPGKSSTRGAKRKTRKLALAKKGLTELPFPVIKHAMQLNRLTVLNFSGNAITELPRDDWASLCGVLKNSLIELNLSSNRLESMPPETGMLVSLQVLDLRSNRLRALPAEICYMLSLEELRVSDNQLQRLPPRMGRMKALRRIKAANNDLTELPVSLCRLPLRELNIKGNDNIQSPDAAIIKRGLKAILQALREADDRIKQDAMDSARQRPDNYEHYTMDRFDAMTPRDVASSSSSQASKRTPLWSNTHTHSQSHSAAYSSSPGASSTAGTGNNSAQANGGRSRSGSISGTHVGTSGGGGSGSSGGSANANIIDISPPVRFNDLESLLRDADGLESFRAFLAAEFSHENLEFWEEVERFRLLKSTKKRGKLARSIFSRYIAHGPDSCEINLPGPERARLCELIEKSKQSDKELGTKLELTVFDTAQQAVMQDMQMDSWPRYKQTVPYRQVVG